jgi:hypothetical protein
MTIDQVFDFKEPLVGVVAPRPSAGPWLGFAAKIKISFAYRLMQGMWRDRNEYTDLGGGTQQFVVGHQAPGAGQSSLVIRLGNGYPAHDG